MEPETERLGSIFWKPRSSFAGFQKTEILIIFMITYQLEKAFLVGVELQKDEIPVAVSLAELARLASTANAQVVGQLSQKLTRPDQRYYIGSGKVTELKERLATTEANLVIFDVDLSPSQARNLEEALEIKVIDRTELILDIFAQHAQSREGKLQVELAQAAFQITRLTGHGAAMSRLGGGIGTRGPGESKLEYDRRRLRDKISELKEAIADLSKDRTLRREKRRKSQIPLITLVGYTNSGKSTLLNALTKSTVLAEDKLFATLDTTVRRLEVAPQKTILLTDTVGFIQKLPHQLVAAFKATLEEVTEADLLLHVVDLSAPNWQQQISAVYQVLEELHAVTKPIITVFNKIDCLSEEPATDILALYEPYVKVSALTGDGLDNLIKLLAQRP
jgi:GTP-binding protein HflX